MPIRLDRGDQVAQFYLRHADRLRRAISAKTSGLDPTLIDDACAFAWEKLLRRPDIDLERPDAYRWVYRVALRQAWALGRAQRREQPAGGLSGADDDCPEPSGIDADIVDVVADRDERATLREALSDQSPTVTAVRSFRRSRNARAGLADARAVQRREGPMQAKPTRARRP